MSLNATCPVTIPFLSALSRMTITWSGWLAKYSRE